MTQQQQQQQNNTAAGKPTPNRPGLATTIPRDIFASIVVFLVALPLCMGIALASGVPEDKAAAIGILAGVIGGLIVGTLSGCPLQVTGPAAGLVVIVADLVSQHGFEILGLIIIVSGVIQIISGLIGLGQIFRAVSPAVIQGMLAGIGMLIFAGQMHVMIDAVPPGNDKELVMEWGGFFKGGFINLLYVPQAIWLGLTHVDYRAAAMIGVLTIMGIVAWGWIVPKRFSFLPAPLVGVILGSAVAAFMGLSIKKIEVPDNIFELAQAIHLPTLGFLEATFSDNPAFIWTILGAGLALAFVASAESLLTAAAADSMQQRAPRTKFGKELFAQGVGNTLAGFLGLLPMTGVIVRTGANIQAGAYTRLSTILHGVWLLAFVVLLPFILQLIPIAALAAVLVYTGWKLMNPKPVRKLAQYGKGEVAIYFVTLIVIVTIDLLMGILAGLALAAIKLLYTFSYLNIRMEGQNGRTILRLEGAATFIRLPKLAKVLENIRPTTELHVHFENLTYIDHACLDLLMNWEKQHQATGGKLVLDWENLTARFHQYGSQQGKARPIADIQPAEGNGADKQESAERQPASTTHN